MDNSYYGAGGERSQDPDAELASAMRGAAAGAEAGGQPVRERPLRRPRRLRLAAGLLGREPGGPDRRLRTRVRDPDLLRYDLEGWHHASAEDSAGLRYRDHFSSNGPDPDRAVAARAVACVELRKPGR